MDFIWGVLALLFIHVLDGIFYKLLAAAYQIFLAVSRINIFATEGGMKVFSTVSTQLYTIIGIAMIFVFAYQLVLLIINPEGGNQKSPSKLFFDTVVSVFVVLVLPTIFNYMTVFQDHVLTNGTIPAILLGTGAAEDIGEDSGYKIALMVMTSFYHPNNSDYTTFYGEDGKLKSSSDAVDACKQNGDDESICQTYYDALKDFDDNKTIGSITGSSTLSKAIYKDETMTYMWVLSTAGAICVTWFLIVYSIDIGTRAVKLGFLQLIAPIPVILRIFPQSRKSFEVWFDEIKKTYVEVFLRLAVIFFAVRLIQLIPALINSVFTSTSASGDGIIIKCIATVLLILGLLKFAQEAPELVKTMFSTGGNWMKGLNFSPKLRKHVEDNKLGMAGIGAAAGMIGGAWGGAQNARRTAAQRAGDGEGSWGKHIGAGIYGGLRGAMTGAVHGAKNAPKELTKESMSKNQDASTLAAQESYNKGTWMEKIIRAGQDAKAEGKGRWKGMYDKADSMVGKTVEDAKKHHQERVAFYQGTSMGKDAKIEKLGTMHAFIDKIETFASQDGKLQGYKQQKREFESALSDPSKGVQVMTDFSKASGNAVNEDGTAKETFARYLSQFSADERAKLLKQVNDGGTVSGVATVSSGSSDYKSFTEQIQKMQDTYQENINKRMNEIYDNAAVADVAHKCMSSFMDEFKASGHQMSAEMAAISKKVADEFNKPNSVLRDQYGGQIQNVEQLADLLSKKDTPITAEMVSLLGDISAELKTQNAAAVLQKKQEAADPGKK